MYRELSLSLKLYVDFHELIFLVNITACLLIRNFLNIVAHNFLDINTPFNELKNHVI